MLTSSAGAASRSRVLKKFHYVKLSQDDLSQAKLRVRCGECGEVCNFCLLTFLDSLFFQGCRHPPL